MIDSQGDVRERCLTADRMSPAGIGLVAFKSLLQKLDDEPIRVTQVAKIANIRELNRVGHLPARLPDERHGNGRGHEV